MNSETSTKRKGRPQAAGGGRTAAPAAGAKSVEARVATASSLSTNGGGIRPWHLFLLGGLAAACAAVVAMRGASIWSLLFIVLAIGAASVSALAVFRTLAPLVQPEAGEATQMIGGRTRAALEREKTLVLRSIKELEFDRAMHKVSETDFREMMGRLRARAAGLITEIDGASAGYRHLIEQDLAARTGRRVHSEQVGPDKAPTVTA